MIRNILTSYYAATILFVLLDYVFGINVRLAFLDDNSGLRMAYYGFCLACFAMMVWRPAWAIVISAVESLITLVAIILHMALRTMIVTEQMIETGQDYVTMSEIFNFMIAGGIAYVAWMRGMRELAKAR
jgi:hypothetical protein